MDDQANDNIVDSCPVASFYSRVVGFIPCSTRWPLSLDTEIILFCQYHVILIFSWLPWRQLGGGIFTFQLSTHSTFSKKCPGPHKWAPRDSAYVIWLTLLASDDWTRGEHLVQARPIKFSPRSRTREPASQALLMTGAVADKFISYGSAMFGLMEREAEKAGL